MSKFIPIPVEEVEEVVEEEITENEVLPPRKTKEIFKMDEDESDDDEPTREIPPPPIPLKKQRSKKQMEHLERMRAKSLATRQAKALKKKQEEEKKRKENAEKIVKETKQIVEQVKKETPPPPPPPPPAFTLNDIESIVNRSVGNALQNHSQKVKQEIQERNNQASMLQNLLKKPKKQRGYF